MKEMNKFITLAAQKLHLAITDQKRWNEGHEKDVFTAITSSDTSIPFQKPLQSLVVGRIMLDELIRIFNAEIGITYEEYCRSIEAPITLSYEDRLMDSFKTVLREAIDHVITEEKA